MNRKNIRYGALCVFILINIQIFEILTSSTSGSLFFEIIIACSSIMTFIETFRGKDKDEI